MPIRGNDGNRINLYLIFTDFGVHWEATERHEAFYEM
jgi:hypothetical protein